MRTPVVSELLLIAVAAFWIWTIVDVARSRFESPNQKIVWLLVVILLGFIGAIIYHLFGRRSRLNT